MLCFNEVKYFTAVRLEFDLAVAVISIQTPESVSQSASVTSRLDRRHMEDVSEVLTFSGGVREFSWLQKPSSGSGDVFSVDVGVQREESEELQGRQMLFLLPWPLVKATISLCSVWLEEAWDTETHTG